MERPDTHPGFHLFECFGIEIEYAIVDQATLSVVPIADRLLTALAGEPASDVTLGPIECSNELVLHVFEMKTAEPVPALEGAATRFQDAVRRVNAELSESGARLMPGAMHPLMDPLADTRLWPHDNREIYAKFDELFGCTGHGWSNLQSVHLNLPFQGDDEFGKLHAAIRLVLPLLPALAASSPVVEGRITGLMDNRLEFYRHNADAIPEVAGGVIPEPVYTRADYERVVFDGIARAIRPRDPEGILDPEWTNSRGAIARFVRDSIEVRVLDSQECPLADLSVAFVTSAVIRALVDERWAPGSKQRSFSSDELRAIFEHAVRDGRRAVVASADFLSCFGLPPARATLGDVWAHLVGELVPASSEFRTALDLSVQHGPLAERLTSRLGASPSRERIIEVYRELCRCLDTGRLFEPGTPNG